jgi:hypothetical protein
MSNPKKKYSVVEYAETCFMIAILAAVAVMAGAAGFTHVHDWTMKYSPPHTDGWFGWANAVISELTPIGSMLAIRRKLRHSPVFSVRIIWFPLLVLVLSFGFSLTAQLSEARHDAFGWMAVAAPTVALGLLVKLALSLLDSHRDSQEQAAEQAPWTAGLAAAAAAEPPATRTRPADPYRFSFTDGHRESGLDVPAATPGRTGSWTPRAVPEGWQTPIPTPRTESATETPAGTTGTSVGTTPGGTESGSGTARERAESTETPIGSSREPDLEALPGINAAEDDNPAFGDEPGTAAKTEPGDQDTDLTPTERARAHWDAERAAGRTPSGAELDRIAGTKDYGRGLRRKWLADEAEAEGRLHAV